MIPCDSHAYPIVAQIGLREIDMQSNVIDIADFLSHTPPFQFMSEQDLTALAGRVQVEFYPKGTLVLTQDGLPSKFLHVIASGGVKVFIKREAGQEFVIDYRSDGDSFGFLSLMNGDISRTNVLTIDDTHCYLIDRATVSGLLEKYPVFAEFFMKSFFHKFINKTYQEMKSGDRMCSGGNQLMFSTRVGELIKRPPVTAPNHISIREAAAVMSTNRISSVVITDEAGVPVGIVTDRDLREKVVSRGRDTNEPVTSIMSVSLIRADAREYCFEALLRILRYGIHHLVVVEEGRFKGIVTSHDFMVLQGSSPISLAREIQIQTSLDGLCKITKKLNEIATILYREGAKASNITYVISELNDRLVKKVIELAQRELGPPPVPFCWIAYGSEGRSEQTFQTDQDNAIIYRDPESPGEALECERYFTAFAGTVNEALERCGVPSCPAKYMASNPKWRQPYSAWVKYFDDWISTPTPEAILNSEILFDFRPVAGDMALAERLRGHVAERAASHGMFLKLLSSAATSVSPPLGFFKRFVVEKDGEHKNMLNLKTRCVALFVNIARLYALERGVTATNTVERMRILKASHSVMSELGEEVEHAFEYVMLLRIKHQVEQIQAGRTPDNFIDPASLSSLDRKGLREACELLVRLQDAVRKHYNPGSVL